MTSITREHARSRSNSPTRDLSPESTDTTTTSTKVVTQSPPAERSAHLNLPAQKDYPDTVFAGAAGGPAWDPFDPCAAPVCQYLRRHDTTIQDALTIVRDALSDADAMPGTAFGDALATLIRAYDEAGLPGASVQAGFALQCAMLETLLQRLQSPAKETLETALTSQKKAVDSGSFTALLRFGRNLSPVLDIIAAEATHEAPTDAPGGVAASEAAQAATPAASALTAAFDASALSAQARTLSPDRARGWLEAVRCGLPLAPEAQAGHVQLVRDFVGLGLSEALAPVAVLACLALDVAQQLPQTPQNGRCRAYLRALLERLERNDADPLLARAVRVVAAAVGRPEPQDDSFAHLKNIINNVAWPRVEAYIRQVSGGVIPKREGKELSPIEAYIGQTVKAFGCLMKAPLPADDALAMCQATMLPKLDSLLDRLGVSQTTRDAVQKEFQDALHRILSVSDVGGRREYICDDLPREQPELWATFQKELIAGADALDRAVSAPDAQSDLMVMAHGAHQVLEAMAKELPPRNHCSKPINVLQAMVTDVYRRLDFHPEQGSLLHEVLDHFLSGWK